MHYADTSSHITLEIKKKLIFLICSFLDSLVIQNDKAQQQDH